MRSRDAHTLRRRLSPDPPGIAGKTMVADSSHALHSSCLSSASQMVWSRRDILLSRDTLTLCLPLIGPIGSRRLPQVFVMKPTDAWHCHHPALAPRLHSPRLGL